LKIVINSMHSSVCFPANACCLRRVLRLIEDCMYSFVCFSDNVFSPQGLANIRMLSKQRYSILFVFVRVAFAKHL
jgi:hypothetical protein